MKKVTFFFLLQFREKKTSKNSQQRAEQRESVTLDLSSTASYSLAAELYTTDCLQCMSLDSPSFIMHP